MSKKRLSHAGPGGSPRMVDVSGKEETLREARAEAVVAVGEAVARLLTETDSLAKGNVLETAQLAGIMGAKKAWELIPLCHPLDLDHVETEATLEGQKVRIVCQVRAQGRTGVEMEAMMGAALAALTVYDMCKSVGKGITVEAVRLLEKKGGRSGVWKRSAS